MLVISEQELLRCIHEELPLERITGRNAPKHDRKHCSNFAKTTRVHAVLQLLKRERGIDVFLVPFGVNMENVDTLLNVVTGWLAGATNPKNTTSWHSQNCAVWGGMILTTEEARQIVTAAVAKTAMKLKLLNLYMEIQSKLPEVSPSDC